MSNIKRDYNTDSESFFNVDWDAEFSEEVTEKEHEILKRVAKRIVKMDMVAPAIMFFETVRPFNYLSSQAMLFLEPFTAYILGFSELVTLRRALSKRESIELIMDYIEQYDYEDIENRPPSKISILFSKLKNKLFKKKMKSES